jgi:hypothetical protein
MGGVEFAIFAAGWQATGWMHTGLVRGLLASMDVRRRDSELQHVASRHSKQRCSVVSRSSGTDEMALQGNLTEITTGGTGKALQFTETSSYYISEDDSFASTGRGVAWAATGQNYLAVYPTGGFLAPSYSQTFWVRLTAQSNAPITIVSSAPYANELSAPTATLNTEHFFLTYVLNNNLLAFVHGNVGYQHPLCSYSIPTSILFNYWLHVGVTFDSGTLTASLYVNGSLVNQTQSNPPYTGHALIHVGYFPDVSYSMEGYLQWLMWTNYALSSVEVQQAYQSTL